MTELAKKLQEIINANKNLTIIKKESNADKTTKSEKE